MYMQLCLIQVVSVGPAFFLTLLISESIRFACRLASWVLQPKSTRQPLKMLHPQSQSCKIIVTCEFECSDGSLFDMSLSCLIIFKVVKTVRLISICLLFFLF